MNQEPRPFTVGLIQMRCSTDPDDNLRPGKAMLLQAADRGAQIACLPELFRTQYFCQTEEAARFDLAEPIPGPTTEELRHGRAEKRRWSWWARSSSAARRAFTITRRSSSTPMVPSAAVIARCTFPTIRSTTKSTTSRPATSGFQAFDTSFARVGTLVCWDQWYPEAARLTALKGADILFYPTAIGWHPAEKVEFGAAQADAWETIQRGHAIANGVYVAAVNRVGHEGPAAGGLEFWGSSFLADPFGRSHRPGRR